jgi:hypothetical protein
MKEFEKGSNKFKNATVDVKVGKLSLISSSSMKTLIYKKLLFIHPVFNIYSVLPIYQALGFRIIVSYGANTVVGDLE